MAKRGNGGKKNLFLRLSFSPFIRFTFFPSPECLQLLPDRRIPCQGYEAMARWGALWRRSTYA